MVKTQVPELNRFMDKRVKVSLIGNNIIIGVLSSVDSFMNMVLDDCILHYSTKPSENLGQLVVRGNNVLLVTGMTGQ